MKIIPRWRFWTFLFSFLFGWVAFPTFELVTKGKPFTGADIGGLVVLGIVFVVSVIFSEDYQNHS